jgi:predicted RNase H-like nuclease (RuvC/YqgF family)
MAVSPATEAKLRAAMQRLLDGTPLCTDRALTKENLAREAGVSHATVHRAQEILAKWDARVGRPILRSTGEVRRDEKIEQLATALRAEKQKVTELHGKLDALASVTANLYNENLTLRRKLDKQTRIVSLDTRDSNPGTFTCS